MPEQEVPSDIRNGEKLQSKCFWFVMSYPEHRIISSLSEEGRLQVIFDEGNNLFEQVGSRVLCKSVKEISENEKQLVEILVYSANFRTGIKDIVSKTGLSKADAVKLLNKYYATYFKIQEWQNKIKESEDLNTTINSLVTYNLLSYFNRKIECISRYVNIYSWNIFDIKPYEFKICSELILNKLSVQRLVNHFFNEPVIINNKVIRIPIYSYDTTL
jgi:hypothetical protein